MIGYERKDITVKITDETGLVSIIGERKCINGYDCLDIHNLSQKKINSYEEYNFKIDLEIYDFNRMTIALKNGLLRLVIPLKDEIV